LGARGVDPLALPRWWSWSLWPPPRQCQRTDATNSQEDRPEAMALVEISLGSIHGIGLGPCSNLVEGIQTSRCVCIAKGIAVRTARPSVCKRTSLDSRDRCRKWNSLETGATYRSTLSSLFGLFRTSRDATVDGGGRPFFDLGLNRNNLGNVDL